MPGQQARKCEQGKSTVVVDLGDTEVAGRDPTVWKGFRIFPAVPEGEDTTATRDNRRLNAFSNPVFDPANDTLFDYPTICADKAGIADWHLYNRQCAVHVDRCPFKCWHCYNDAWPTQASRVKSGQVSSDELLSWFLKQRDFDSQQGKHTRILRITGGEPFAEAQLILDTTKLIHQYNAKQSVHAPAIVWTETDLVPFINGQPCSLQNRTEYLKKLAQYNNCLVVHPCFHGLSDEEIRTITGSTVTFEQLTSAFEELVNANLELYPTIHSNVLNPRHFERFFGILFDMHPNLPLRIALIELNLSYPAVQERMKDCAKKRRSPYLGSRHAALYEWDRLISRRYGFGYGVIPRHLVPLEEGASFAKPYERCSTAGCGKRLGRPDIGERQLLLLKSSDRDTYRQRALTIFGLPRGFIVSINYDKEWIPQDIAELTRHWPENLENLPLAVCYAERKEKENVIAPLRTASTKTITGMASVLNFNYRLGGYPKAAVQAELDPHGKSGEAPNLAAMLWRVFGERTLAPTGTVYAVLSPYFEALADFTDGEPTETEAWQAIVEKLGQLPKLRDAAFCRVTIDSNHKVKTTATGAAERSYIGAKGLDVIKLSVHYRVPNWGAIQKRGGSPPTLCVQVSDPDLVSYWGPEEFPLSKYGEIKLHFKCAAPERLSETEIRIWRSDAPTLGPDFRIPVGIGGGKRVLANALTGVISVLGVAATGLGGALLAGSVAGREGVAAGGNFVLALKYLSAAGVLWACHSFVRWWCSPSVVPRGL